jgi:uncharacterized integral membrane protein
LRLRHWLATLLAAFILVIFALSNLQPVQVAFWPLPIEIETRLFVVVLLAMALGFFLGEGLAWLGGRRSRREARQRARRIEALERELGATQAQLAPSVSVGDNASVPLRTTGATRG